MKSCENWSRCMRRAWMPLLLLPMTFVLAGCQSTTETLIGGTEKRSADAEQAIADDVCRAWPVTPYSSRDTPETQTGNRANNAARDAYCRGK